MFCDKYIIEFGKLTEVLEIKTPIPAKVLRKIERNSRNEKYSKKGTQAKPGQQIILVVKYMYLNA